MGIAPGDKDFRAKFKAHVDAQKASFKRSEPPFDPRAIFESTVVDGKTVEVWAGIISTYVEEACAKGDKVVDCTQFGWAQVAVNEWVARGKPRERSEAIKRSAELVEKAESLVKFASMDDDKAKEWIELGNKKKADKLREAATKKREQSEALRKEAKTVIGG
jgi:hypothetical protein